jgi:hypothetical protein
VWRGPSYDPSEKIVGFDHFSDDLGYGADDRAALLKLLPKKIFAMSPDHEVERIK